MPSNKSPFNTIKVRVTLLTLAVFIISIWLLAYVASRKLQHDMTMQIGTHQLAATALLASQINEDLQLRTQSLESLAEKISNIGMKDSEAIAQFLKGQQVIQRDYNAGAFVINQQGTAIASINDDFGRVGLNYQHINSIAHTLERGQSQISDIHFDETIRLRMVYIASPIHDAAGHVTGALVGVTDLAKSSFLDKISHSYYGKTGYYLPSALSARWRNLQKAPSWFP